jgi:hypothetical protein
MNPSRFASILDVVTRLLGAGTEAIAPTNPAVAADLQLGLLLNPSGDLGQGKNGRNDVLLLT